LAQPKSASLRGAGFSLIEVMLAVLVVSVGMLAILTLFPMALDQNSRAVASSQSALFADEVLSGLRACAEADWNGFTNTIISRGLPVVAAAQFPGVLNIIATNTIETNIYSNTLGVVNHALRYQLTLTGNGNIKTATLKVWNGQFSATGAAPSVYYTEFFNTRPQ
jgi:prepilin-type N-terminal cleavage/methylation domain-containing protein